LLIWILKSGSILDSQLNIDVDIHMHIHCHMGDQKKFFQLLVGIYTCVLIVVHGVYARGLRLSWVSTNF